jgi:hypothetical protein
MLPLGNLLVSNLARGANSWGRLVGFVWLLSLIFFQVFGLPIGRSWSP